MLMSGSSGCSRADHEREDRHRNEASCRDRPRTEPDTTDSDLVAAAGLSEGRTTGRQPGQRRVQLPRQVRGEVRLGNWRQEF